MEMGYLPNKFLPLSFYADTADFYGKRAKPHETEKQRPAARFVQAAAKEVYGFQGYDARGPVPTAFRPLKHEDVLEVVYDVSIKYKAATSYSGTYTFITLVHYDSDML